MSKRLVYFSIFLSILFGASFPVAVVFFNFQSRSNNNYLESESLRYTQNSVSEIFYKSQKRVLVSISGNSMEPLYYPGDTLCLQASLDNLSLGETIIYSPESDKDNIYIKRIFALPGQKINFENKEISLLKGEYFVSSQNPELTSSKQEVVRKEQIWGVVIYKINSLADSAKCLAKL